MSLCGTGHCDHALFWMDTTRLSSLLFIAGLRHKQTHTRYTQKHTSGKSKKHTKPDQNKQQPNTFITMRFSITTILAATGALAAPVSINPQRDTTAELTTRSNTLANNTSKCSGYNDAFWNVNTSAFSVTIGRPYLGGGKCPTIKEKVAQDFTLSGLKCKGANDNKNTVITITSNMKAANLANINKALKNAYPEIEFSCPTQLRK